MATKKAHDVEALRAELHRALFAAAYRAGELSDAVPNDPYGAAIARLAKVFANLKKASYFDIDRAATLLEFAAEGRPHRAAYGGTPVDGSQIDGHLRQAHEHLDMAIQVARTNAAQPHGKRAIAVCYFACVCSVESEWRRWLGEEDPALALTAPPSEIEALIKAMSGNRRRWNEAVKILGRLKIDANNESIRVGVDERIKQGREAAIGTEQAIEAAAQRALERAKKP